MKTIIGLKKRITSIFLAVLMICAMCVPVMAEEQLPEQEEQLPTMMEIAPEQPEQEEDERTTPSLVETEPADEAVVNNAVAKFGSLILRNGSGTAEDPYVITAAYQMNNLAEETNKGTSDFTGVYFKLGTSIPLNLSAPIGTKEHPFKGNFDGGGNSIQLIVNKENQDYVGLFGYAVGSQFKNVTIRPVANTCKITGNNYVGSVCGYLENGSISNCTNAGDVIGGGDYVGGICGGYDNSNISNCTNAGTVSSIGIGIGGICGSIYGSNINICINTGAVSGKGTAGGIVGDASNVNIINCTNEGLVTIKTNYCGGLYGYTVHCKIINCVNSGTITGSNGATRMAGLIGLMANDSMDSFPYLNSISVGEYLTYKNLPPEKSTNEFSNLFGDRASDGRFIIPKGSNLYYDNSIIDIPLCKDSSFTITLRYDPGRTTEEMKSAEMLATLNQYVSDHPELGLLSWKRNPNTGYPCLDYSTANDSDDPVNPFKPGKHTHSGSPQSGVTPSGKTVTYYKCEWCGKYFEDSACTKEITDLNAWLAKVDSEDKSGTIIQTGDTSNMTPWIVLMLVSLMGLAVCIVSIKRKVE